PNRPRRRARLRHQRHHPAVRRRPGAVAQRAARPVARRRPDPRRARLYVPGVGADLLPVRGPGEGDTRAAKGPGPASPPARLARSMADRITQAQRSAVMSRIRSKDTKPELAVRRLLHRLGYRYRLHTAKLKGRPDLVFPSRSAVVFVHGCYWH